jgi:uncharacterized protein YdaU (DUF1376 family)
MTARSPDFKMDFYTKDFLASTLSMTGPERGAYALALIVAWTQHAAFPTDSERIGKICGYDPRDWRKVWPALEPKFPLTADGTARRNPREVERWNEEYARAAKASEKGKYGNEVRWGRSPEESPGDPPAIPGGIPGHIPEVSQSPSPSPSSSSSSSPEGKEKEKERDARSPDFPIPSVEDVRDFIEGERPKLGPFNAAVFVDFYISNGWYVGKSPMKDWRAAARKACRVGWTTKEAPADPLSPAEKKRREDEQEAALEKLRERDKREQEREQAAFEERRQKGELRV